MNQNMTNLTEKQVINICDGRILGYVTDFKIDPCDGRLTAIIVPGEGGFFSLKRCADIVIPWEKICKIGKDTILVDIGIFNESNAFFDDKSYKKHKK